MKQTIFALGFFAGVHLGHQSLLTVTRQLAGSRFTPGAVTFAVHPQTLVGKRSPGLINTQADRERLLRRFGMETVITLPFDKEMQSLSWDAFLEMLIREHHAAGFVCGVDFRFGSGGRGNAQTLARFCRERGLLFAAVPECARDGARISSTRIRDLLSRGDVEGANALLGHPHMYTGTVVPGQQLGRRLGFPTANLRPEKGLALPRFGVYACRCHLGGEVHTSVTNVGMRPTVEGDHVTLESWLLDFSGNLYGQEITLEFIHFLRPERKFESLEALKAQIFSDARQARQMV